MGALVAQEGRHLVRCRTDAGEIKGHPTNPSPFCRWNCGRPTLCFEAGEDKSIHRLPGPLDILHCRRAVDCGFRNDQKLRSFDQSTPVPESAESKAGGDASALVAPSFATTHGLNKPVSNQTRSILHGCFQPTISCDANFMRV